MTNTNETYSQFNNTSNITRKIAVTVANQTAKFATGRAGVYHTSDFIAMAVVFTVVLILSILWQKRFPPFCLFKKPQPKDDTFENEIPPSNLGKY